ncbi:MAG: hypothetical protein GQ544_03605, partial [Candidatus Aminicenantes bacterium]|nr:hypothetical protein [Candidatus Aminicenantes bacterium]
MKNKNMFVLTGLILILIFSLSGQKTEQNWQAKTLWESKEKIQRVIVADIDPKQKGDEIVSVAANGEVVYSYLSSGKWENDLLWTDTESLTGAAVGELDAAHPGSEIIVGGVSGVVELIQFDTKKHQTIFDKGGSIHGLSIGELNATYPSQEVVVVDEDGQLFVLFKDGDWKSKLLLKDTGRLRDSVIGDFDRAHPGLEALVVGTSAKVIQVYTENGNWKTKTINQASEALGRIAEGEILKKFPGPEVVVVGDKGGVYLLKQEKGIWNSKEIFRDSEGLRGVAVADVQP